MDLMTRLNHIDSEDQFIRVIGDNDKVMICCGRMGPMCVPVYSAMEILKDRYTDVLFCDMPFDHPDAHVIRNLPECRGFMGLPFTVYFNKGKVARATTSIQTQEQVESILKEIF